jgi:hypothetical protein
LIPFTFVVFQACFPPAGCREETTLPFGPTATHKDFEGHEIEFNGPRPRMAATDTTLRAFQALNGPVGTFEVRTLPSESTAAQNDADGQETSTILPGVSNGGMWSTTAGCDQEIGEAALAGVGHAAATIRPTTSAALRFMVEARG